MGAGASLTFGGGTLSELDAKQQIGVYATVSSWADAESTSTSPSPSTSIA